MLLDEAILVRADLVSAARSLQRIRIEFMLYIGSIFKCGLQCLGLPV